MRLPKSLLFTATAMVVVVTAAACGGDGQAPITAPDQASRLLTNLPPVAIVNLTTLGPAGCQLGVCSYNYEYDAYQSYDPDGSIASYRWERNSGTLISTNDEFQLTALRAYEDCGGTQRARLIVTDNAGAADTACFGWNPV